MANNTQQKKQNPVKAPVELKNELVDFDEIKTEVKAKQTKRDETIVKARATQFYAGKHGVFVAGKVYEMPKYLVKILGAVEC